MSVTMMLSKTVFAVTVIILFVIIAFLWLFQLPEVVKTLLWYLTFVVLFFAVTSWIVYKHNKNKHEEGEQAGKSRAAYTPDGEEPTIGKTYRLKDD